MARVDVQVSGGDTIRGREARTVGDLKRQLSVQSYNAQVNGDPQRDDYVLPEMAFVTLTENMKGA